MIVKITGNVRSAEGFLEGIQDLDEKEAKRLVRLGVAEEVEEPKEKPLSTLNKAELFAEAIKRGAIAEDSKASNYKKEELFELLSN